MIRAAPIYRFSSWSILKPETVLSIANAVELMNYIICIECQLVKSFQARQNTLCSSYLIWYLLYVCLPAEMLVDCEPEKVKFRKFLLVHNSLNVGVVFAILYRFFAETCGLDDVFPLTTLVLARVFHLLYTYQTLWLRS